MASSSKQATCSSPFSSGRFDQVFLSFRGCDTRDNFASRLYTSLDREGIKVWIDDELTRGTTISVSLVKAIKQSRVSVVILSPNYVNSRWCLEELVKIFECKDQNILPVFDGVDPSDISNRRGDYAKAFARHERYYGTELVQKWRLALEEAARLSSSVADWNGGESGFVENVVEIILKRLRSPSQKEESIVRFRPQGADVFSNTEDLQSFLNGLKEVAMRNNYNDVYSLRLTISRRRPKITNWKKGDLIGRGSFASVYIGLIGDGFFFAVKEVSLNDKKRVLCLKNEIAVLTKLDHENIVQYYGTEMDEEKLYIFLELVRHGTVEQAYKSCRLEESQVSQCTRQILQGLTHLHDCRVIHGDLKCENILVNESGKIKLTDFGWLSFIEDGVLLNPRLRSSFWMAPEAANRKSAGYSFPADIWSLGCTVLEISTGKHPQYDVKNDVQLEFAIRNKDKKPIIPDYLSHRLKDFIHECLQPDPNKRPTAAELLAHPFVNESSCTQPDLIELLSGERAPIINKKRKLIHYHS